jgi:Holliday junction resolvase RusA-like endonuclease
MIEIIVPGNPIALKRHRHTHSGHTYDPSKADKNDFLSKSLEWMPKTPIEGVISMVLEFYIARPKSHYRTGKFSDEIKGTSPVHKVSRPDLDNYIKFVFDALNKVFYVDDSQITHVDAYKHYSQNPKTIVRIIT